MKKRGGGGGGGRGGGEKEKKRKKEKKRGEIPTFFIKSFSPPPRAESEFWYTMLSRETEKSDPGGDHYYVGCLGQTRV